MEPPYNSALSGPLISVILPVYNRSAWIARAIDSVLSQTYQRIELLVIDDGSTDATRRVLESYGSRITVLSQSHEGAEAARNLGLQCARGEFVAFIDSDDCWYSNRLSSQLPLFNRAEVGLVFGNAALVDYRLTPPQRLKRTFFDNVRPSRGRVMEAFTRGCFVPCSSVLARRQCFVESGGFRVGRASADYLKWLEIAANFEFDYIREPIFEYAIHSGGLSNNLIESLEDRSAAFSEMLAQNSNPAMARVVRRILFNLSWHLRIARLRQRSEARSETTTLKGSVADASPGERLIWSLKFSFNQLRTRLRWWVLRFKSLVNDWRAQPESKTGIHAGDNP
jgi:glycosyltransferase involved in cell wall biosynthesis